MAKFHGKIGYVNTVETAPGVWSENITEYNYYGDVLRNSQRWEKGEGLNDNLTITNQFSVLGDWPDYSNFAFMRYITWMNAKWKIISVELQRPRLIITVGGIYNAP